MWHYTAEQSHRPTYLRFENKLGVLHPRWQHNHFVPRLWLPYYTNIDLKITSLHLPLALGINICSLLGMFLDKFYWWGMLKRKNQSSKMSRLINHITTFNPTESRTTIYSLPTQDYNNIYEHQNIQKSYKYTAFLRKKLKINMNIILVPRLQQQTLLVFLL